MIVLTVFKHELPYPYTPFLLGLIFFALLNIILQIVLSRKILLSYGIVWGTTVDAFGNLIFIMCSGGFLSPFVLTSMLSLISSGIMPGSSKNFSKKLYISFLLCFNSLLILQKIAIIPNDVSYSNVMMQNNVFFWLILVLQNTLILLSYSLIITFNDFTKSKLDSLRNSYTNIVEGTSLKNGGVQFNLLTHHLAEALKVSTVFVGCIDEKNAACIPISVWNKDKHVDIDFLPIKGNCVEQIIEKNELFIEKNCNEQFLTDTLVTSFSLKGLFGMSFKDEQNNLLGILMIADTNPLPNDYTMFSTVKIFASYARAEISRKRSEDEKNKIQEHLAQSQKLEAIGHLAGGIAHDFNNLLSAIIGYAELIKRKKTVEYSLRYSQKIITVCHRATNMTKQLLQYARRGSLTLQQLNINKVIATVTEMLRHTLDKNIIITTDLQCKKSIIEGDFSHLQNALLNLGINARDAMPEGGTLTFHSELALISSSSLTESVKINPGEYIKISVSDTGKGMDPDVQKHIFEPFFTTKPPGKGTGLGLSTVYGCIQNHKGYITFESIKDKGTQFFIYIPLSNDQSLHEEDSATSVDELGQKVAKHTIMIVDDDPEVRESLVLFLQDLNFNVIEFSDGTEAIKYFKHHSAHIDLILLDMIMPKINGKEVFFELVKLDQKIKVLFMSGYSNDKDFEELVLQKKVGFLPKPINHEEVIKEFASILT